MNIMLNKIRKWGLISMSTMVLACLTPSATLARWFWDMIGVSWVGTIWTEHKQEDNLLHTIRVAINWLLWMLSTISLCLVLYAWFLMLTSWWDNKKYDLGFSIIKKVAVWLTIIAVSWLIVSLIFYIIDGSVGPLRRE